MNKKQALKEIISIDNDYLQKILSSYDTITISDKKDGYYSLLGWQSNRFFHIAVNGNTLNNLVESAERFNRE